jgi:hypothetical protein
MVSNNKLPKLIEHYEEFGLKSLLPQNLSELFLQEFIFEYEAFKNDTLDKHAPSMILMAVIIFEHEYKKIPFEKVEQVLKPEEIMEKYNFYGMAVVVEDLRRKGIIDMSQNDLPNVKNIFDANRKIPLVF